MSNNSNSLLQRLQGRWNASGGGFAWNRRPVHKRVEPVRQVVVSNRWDDRAWERARETDVIENDIRDLYVGDLDAMARGEEDARGPYDNAPELVRDLWVSLYKPYARLRKDREVKKDARLNRKILEELFANPQFQLLQSKCAMDAVTSTMATDAFMDAIKEILTRKGDARDDSNKRRKEDDGQEQGRGPQGNEPGGNPGPTGNPGGDQQGGQPGNGPSGPKGQPSKEKGDGHSDEDGEGEGEKGEKGGTEPDKDDWGSQGGNGEDESDESEGDGNGEGEEGDGEGEGDLDGDGSEQIDDVDRAWDEAIAEAEEREDNEKLAALLGEDADDIERLLNKALNEASDEIGELESVRRGIGLEDGEWKMMDPAKRWEYAERFKTPQMRALADIVGRMIRFASGCQATKINNVPHEIYDVGNGDDPTQALQSELALLGTPESELLFFQRMVDKELLVYKKRGTEEAGKGPIVIAIDKSGSMNGAPFNWAMAVSEALRRICAEQDRDYYAMFFGSNRDRNRFWFPKGKPLNGFDEVLAFLSCIANGGTEFDGVLTEALERVQTQFNDEGKGKADIVFVTDGQAHLDDEWIKRFNDERHAIGARVYGVFVGGAYDYGDGTNRMMEFMRRFCDEVLPVSEFKPESVREIFSRV